MGLFWHVHFISVFSFDDTDTFFSQQHHIVKLHEYLLILHNCYFHLLQHDKIPSKGKISQRKPKSKGVENTLTHKFCTIFFLRIMQIKKTNP